MENIRKLSYKEVEDIVFNSNPEETVEDRKGTGFWLFAKEFDKAPKTYINIDSPWKPVYYGLFDNDNKTCLGLVCLTYNYTYGYKNYPHVLIIQSIKVGIGVKLIYFVYRLVQKEGYNGITIYPLTKELAEKYKRLGFEYYEEPRMQKTFKNYINDSVAESKIYENYLSGTWGDPTFSTNTPGASYSPGYMYSIRNLNHSLEGNRQPSSHNYSLLHIGSYVSGKNKNGETVYGRIYKITKDSDGFIKKVYIFNKNAKIINIDIDSIVGCPNGAEYRNQFSNIDINTKIPISESIKHNGPKELSVNGKKYLLTLNEGRVVVCELNHKQITSLTDLYDIDNNLARRFLNKL